MKTSLSAVKSYLVANWLVPVPTGSGINVSFFAVYLHLKLTPQSVRVIWVIGLAVTNRFHRTRTTEP